MPLRKQDEVPKIPKTRKKTIDKLKKATPAKKSGETEYLCEFYFHYDQIKKKQFAVLTISTVKDFTYLTYEVSVDVRKTRNVIDISLLGLNTVPSYYVQPKPARTDLFFDDLLGTFEFNLIKQDGSINSVTVDFNIFKKEITIRNVDLPEKLNNREFCKFSVADSMFTFGGKN